MSFGAEFRTVTITGTYDDAATGGHGVACIQYQIKDDLLNLAGSIRTTPRSSASSGISSISSPINRLTECRSRIQDRSGTADKARPRAAEHRHQLVDKPGTLFSRFADLLGKATQSAIWFQARQDQFTGKHHPVSRLLKSWATPQPGDQWPPFCEHLVSVVQSANFVPRLRLLLPIVRSRS